jgi:hypothetical protein
VLGQTAGDPLDQILDGVAPADERRLEPAIDQVTRLRQLRVRRGGPSDTRVDC